MGCGGHLLPHIDACSKSNHTGAKILFIQGLIAVARWGSFGVAQRRSQEFVMGWERRGKVGKLVYYRVARREPDGRVVKEYLGAGHGAQQAAAEVDARRHKAEADRQAVQDEVERLTVADALTAEVTTASAVLMAAVLVADGWGRTNYGPWRKRRGH